MKCELEGKKKRVLCTNHGENEENEVEGGGKRIKNERRSNKHEHVFLLATRP